MATSHDRTPIAQLVAPFVRVLKSDRTDDASVAAILTMMFDLVCDDVRWKEALDQKYANLEKCLAAIKGGTTLAEECRKSIKSKDWQPVFALLEEEKLKQPPIPPQEGVGLMSARFAWDLDFVGEAHKQLLSEMRAAANRDSPYSMITPVVQSSGTGKSRTVDELAKCVFTIPICLRHPDETGYPRGDAPLWTFFNRKISLPSAQLSCIDLLRSILRECSKILRSEPINADDLARGWYDRLKPINGARNPVRSKLYTDACNNLTNSKDFISARDELVEEFRTLASLLPSEESFPRAIIYIDECHYLSVIDMTVVTVEKSSVLDAMLYAIDLCRSQDLFGIILSTNLSFGEISPRARFATQRRSIARPLPFTLSPFDRWNGSTIINESKSTLRDICTLEFSARFGRPLWWTRLANPITEDLLLDELVRFAAQKLMLGGAGSHLSEEAKMAALSARLALRLDTSLESVRSLQVKLVERHMSVAYDVPDHKNYMYSGYPSEPILMEGAAYVWNSPIYRDFIPLETLQKAVTNGFLAKGERGELVGRYICLRAIDICVVKGGHDFIGDNRMFGKAVPLLSYFQAIFGPQWKKICTSKARNRSGGKELETACEGKYVRFTHFARAGDASALSTAAGWKALARGNAWQFVDRQQGVDLGIPVFDGNPEDVLDREHVTWILIQIKNSSGMRAVHFSAESLGLFDDRDSEKQTPYFVLVFQFSVKAKSQTTTSGADSSKPITSRASPCYNKEFSGAVSVDEREPTHDAHPCYWVGVFGCSSKVFNPEIIPEGTGVFKQLASRDILNEARDRKKVGILGLKPFFEAGPTSYDWAGDDENGCAPGTMCYADEEEESVNAVQAVEAYLMDVDDD